MAKFADLLAATGFSRYADYLASEGWAAFCRRYRESGLPLHCRVCNSPCVQFHHVAYDRLGRERFGDVTPLCDGHHKAVHAWLKARGLPVARTDDAVRALRLAPVRTGPNPGPEPAGKRKAKPKAAAVPLTSSEQLRRSLPPGPARHGYWKAKKKRR